jgi:hypothetical protein
LSIFQLIDQDAEIVEILMNPINPESIEAIQLQLQHIQEFKKQLYGNGKFINSNSNFKKSYQLKLMKYYTCMKILLLLDVLQIQLH